MQTTFQLTGKKAIVALVVIVAVLAYQFVNRQQTLQTDAVDQIKQHLASDYTRHHLPELQLATQTGQLTEARAEEIVRQVSGDNIDIVSISARGRKGHFVTRVEVEIDGASPPDGRRIRYFRMTHSTINGWWVKGESTKWGYYLAL